MARLIWWLVGFGPVNFCISGTLSDVTIVFGVGSEDSGLTNGSCPVGVDISSIVAAAVEIEFILLRKLAGGTFIWNLGQGWKNSKISMFCSVLCSGPKIIFVFCSALCSAEQNTTVLEHVFCVFHPWSWIPKRKFNKLIYSWSVNFYDKILKNYGGYHEMPQKACERWFIHVMAFS